MMASSFEKLTSPSLSRSQSFTPRSMGMAPAAPLSARGSQLPHAAPVYNSARGSLTNRYSTSDWELSNKGYFSLSEKERACAEQLRGDAFRAVKTTDMMTRNRQANNTKRLGERVNDISFWKSELNAEIRAMQQETELLDEFRQTLKKAHADTAPPLAASEECILQREQRQGIDLVADGVEGGLTSEVKSIKACQAKMQRMLEKACVQLKMNRAAQHACESDVRDKGHAHNLDDKCHGLHNASGGIGLYPGIEGIDNTLSIPESWMKFSRENIGRSQRERELSERLRNAIDQLLRECANKMYTQYTSVNNAFGARVHETQDAKNKLSAHLGKVVQEIADMERAVAQLRRAIHDKEAPLKVAQTRLEERTRRLNVETCNDPVMKGLQREVAEIKESVRCLKEKLAAAESALSRLCRTRASLQHDIGVKDNSLAIDSKRCASIRKTMAMEPKVGPTLAAF